MATQAQDIQARVKQEVESTSEPTTAGRVYSPSVDILKMIRP